MSAEQMSPISRCGTPDTDRRIPLILSIDDDPDISHTIEMRLRDYNVKVKRAFYGIQGFSEVIRELPDLILLDMVMPQGNGQFVLECIKHDPCIATIPVIVLTGSRDPGLRNLAFQMGAAQFMQKPIEFAQLLVEMRRHVDIRENTSMRLHHRSRAVAKRDCLAGIENGTHIFRFDLDHRISHDENSAH